LIFYQICGFLSITFEPETLESHQRLKRLELQRSFHEKLESKNWLLRLGPKARWPRPKRPKHTPLTTSPTKNPKLSKIFSNPN